MELLNKEQAQKLVKPSILALLSQVPVASAFSTFYSEFVNSSWQERVEKTQAELIQRLSKLDETFESKLRERSNFASLLGTAYQSALKDIDEDKIPLYINSLINAIDNETLDNTKIHIYLNFLSDFTLLHIKTLEYFSDRHDYIYDIRQDMCLMRQRTHEEVIASLIQQSHAELVNDIDLFDTVINDLYTKGLLDLRGLSSINIETFGSQKPIMKHTTSLGDSFLHFIENSRGR